MLFKDRKSSDLHLTIVNEQVPPLQAIGVDGPTGDYDDSHGSPQILGDTAKGAHQQKILETFQKAQAVLEQTEDMKTCIERTHADAVEAFAAAKLDMKRVIEGTV